MNFKPCRFSEIWSLRDFYREREMREICIWRENRLTENDLNRCVELIFINIRSIYFFLISEVMFSENRENMRN
jgi:hypothetical protein